MAIVGLAIWSRKSIKRNGD